MCHPGDTCLLFRLFSQCVRRIPTHRRRSRSRLRRRASTGGMGPRLHHSLPRHVRTLRYSMHFRGKMTLNVCVYGVRCPLRADIALAGASAQPRHKSAQAPVVITQIPDESVRRERRNDDLSESVHRVGVGRGASHGVFTSTGHADRAQSKPEYSELIG